MVVFVMIDMNWMEGGSSDS